MQVLVDYDNLDARLAKAGVQAICTQLAATLGAKRDDVPTRCRIRLYGGWYEEKRFSRRAQLLIPEINRHFPQAVLWTAKNEKRRCLTEVQMAYCLEADPSRHLFRTLRHRPFCARLHCDSEPIDNCPSAVCPMRGVVEFLQKQGCPEPGCSVTQADVLRKWEQKLIDTMLVSDLILMASRGDKDLVVVSSDDDIWPGVRTAVQLGAQVTLIHTSKRKTPVEYTSGVHGIEQLIL